MSGHSKWNNIKHKKEKADAAKAKIFTKIGKEMAVAIKVGGPDPNNNSKLRDLIAKAKANNVPNDNIQRTIKKFTDNGDINFEEIVYEGYGPSGVAIIVETQTDNRNRTAGNVRAAFSKYGGNLGQNGCVGYLIEQKGVSPSLTRTRRSTRIRSWRMLSRQVLRTLSPMRVSTPSTQHLRILTPFVTQSSHSATRSTPPTLRKYPLPT